MDWARCKIYAPVGAALLLGSTCSRDRLTLTGQKSARWVNARFAGSHMTCLVDIKVLLSQCMLPLSRSMQQHILC